MTVSKARSHEARNFFEFFSRAFDREPFEIRQLDIQRELRVLFW
jgi:hypothetical protein